VEPFSAVKVVGAFVAGVVVALGSALIYVRVSDNARPQAAIQTPLPAATPPTDLSSPKAPINSPQPDSSKEGTTGQDADLSSTPPKLEPPHKRPIVSEPKHVKVKATRPTGSSERETVDVAQNTTPSVPVATSKQADPPPALQETQSSQPPVVPEQQAAAAPAAEPQRQPHVVTLPAGLNLTVRLTETVSSDHNYTGDTFRATLDAPIIMDGFIIADRNSKILGRVMNAEKAGRFEGGALVSLALTEIHTTDGQTVKIETNSNERREQGSGAQNTAKIAGGAALGAIIGAAAGGGKGAGIGAGAGGAAGTGAVLLSHGKPAVMPVETRLTFRLSSPVTITEHLN